MTALAGRLWQRWQTDGSEGGVLSTAMRASSFARPATRSYGEFPDTVTSVTAPRASAPPISIIWPTIKTETQLRSNYQTRTDLVASALHPLGG